MFNQQMFDDDDDLNCRCSSDRQVLLRHQRRKERCDGAPKQTNNWLSREVGRRTEEKKADLWTWS